MEPVIQRPLTIKLVILYTMDRYEKPLPDSAFSNIIIGNLELNYFDAKQYLYELTEVAYARSYVSEGCEYHEITPAGREAIHLFRKNITYALREKINRLVKEEKLAQSRQNEFRCDYIPVNDIEYNVQCVYNEADQPIFDLTFRAGDRENARDIAMVLRKHSGHIYQDI